MQVQQGEAGAAGGGQPSGQLELLQGRGGEVLDRHEQALEAGGIAMEAGHHHRARHLAAGCLHQVAKQPAPQPGRGIQPHHHQVRILLKGRCGYAAGDIAAGALKPLPAGAALLGSHHLERHQPAWHGALAVRQQAGQLDQPPFPGWIGDRHQHRQPTPFQGGLAVGLRPR